MIDYIMTMPTSEAMLWWAGLGWVGAVLASISEDRSLLSLSDPGAAAIFLLMGFLAGSLMGPPMLLYALGRLAVKAIKKLNLERRSPT